jgi:ubiquinone/menaquinone biosynthesis C-methylase UbiE
LGKRAPDWAVRTSHLLANDKIQQEYLLMNNDHETFWEKRAQDYNALQWARNRGYLESFIHHGDFQPTDVVLDVGTGTGLVAHAIAPLVSRVVGIDFSESMLRQAFDNRRENQEFLINDVRKIDFPDGTFTKVTARMIFHHVLEGTVGAMQECHRVLVPGGTMIFSEGVPPHPSLRDWYTEMFALKEERLTFCESDMIDLMKAGGFDKIAVHTHISRQVSIRNWLQKSGIGQENQDAIWQMHLALDSQGRRHYNLQSHNGDILLDMKFVILVGCKAL